MAQDASQWVKCAHNNWDSEKPDNERFKGQIIPSPGHKFSEDGGRYWSKKENIKAGAYMFNE